jgi:GH43 family beta-xylosidase
MRRQVRDFQYASRLAFETLEERLALDGAGLTAQYFHNSDFTGLAETRTEAVAFNWGTGNPAAGVNADSFSVRWTGQVEAEFSNVYTFTILSDEGVRLWVDGQMLIDDWTPHIRRNQSGTIALQAGQRYDIRIDYFELSGPAQIEMRWSSVNQSLQIIPANRLYESPSGLFGAYADNTSGSLSRIDPTVDFNWGLGQPDAALDADGFAVNWTGQVRADFSEEYIFATISDDGVRLWIGNELVIDNWTVHGAIEDVGTKWLEAGKWYEVRLEYFENTGFAEIELRWSSDSQTGSGVFDVIPGSHLRAMKRTAVVFENPLGPGADPFVIQWQGNYYLTRSQGNSVWIDRAASLQDIHSSDPGSDSALVWTAPPSGNYSQQIWAPELHFLGGKWYIYVAASNGDNATHRMHVLERSDPDPFGPFTYRGQISAPTDRWAIDGTVLSWQGTNYFVWSGWPGFTDGQQNLYIAEMRDPTTLRGDRVLLSAPVYGWERHGLPINEGPQILIEDGHLHIIYSASGYWTPQYALGRLTYDGTGSLLDPANWIKATQPVFDASSQVVGVGHASFTKSPDGNEDWIVYHAHANPFVFNEDRVISIQPFTYFADGTPNFGDPVPPHVPLPIPSTGPDAERSFITGDFNADGIVNAADESVWQATFGATIFPGSSADGTGDGSIDTADYIVWRKNQSPAEMGAVAVIGNEPMAPPGSQVPMHEIDVTGESPIADISRKTQPNAAIEERGAVPINTRQSSVTSRPLPSVEMVTDAVFQTWSGILDRYYQRVLIDKASDEQSPYFDRGDSVFSPAKDIALAVLPDFPLALPSANP